MKNTWVVLIYIGFFTLIGVSVFFTKSAWPLLALLIAPEVYKKVK